MFLRDSVLTSSFLYSFFFFFPFLPGILEWPFWTKLVVVAIGFTGGLLFMYVQCKVYVQLWKRLKAYNRVIYVQNCPETSKKNIFEKPALMEPNFESKEMLGVHHSDTNSSHYTEPEDCAAEILHVWLLAGRGDSVCPWRFKISLFTASCSTFLKSANSWGLADDFFYICVLLEFF